MDDLHQHGAKDDKTKVRAGLVLRGFARALWEVSRVGTFGARKYSDGGWVGVAPERYGDAQMRHWLKDAMGEVTDKESDLDHLAHEAWNALARLELKLREREADDKDTDDSISPDGVRKYTIDDTVLRRKATLNAVYRVERK